MILLLIIAVLGWWAYRQRGWRGVAYVAIAVLGIYFLSVFALIFLGGQVSSILVEP